MEVDIAAKSTNEKDPNFLHVLAAGAVAGVVVDIVLFPIDTIKTRLQSEAGFLRAGGFSGIYRGLAPVAAGSAPTAALFFGSYEGFKNYFSKLNNNKNSTYINMASASLAEIIACLIRVPVEIAKQRRQALGNTQSSALHILWDAYRTEGIRRGLYRGYGSTILREIPFSFIQFPLWEYLKLQWTPLTGTESTPLSVALCGAVAGGIAAGLTTPLDVVKTRIMLAERDSETKKLSTRQILTLLYRERGIKGLFAGFVPRVLWITLGGAFFFGFYDLTTRLLNGDVLQNENAKI